MNDFLDAVGAALDAVGAALDALRAAVGERGVEGLAPGELMAVNRAFGLLKRTVDAAYAPVASEIGRQSRPELGKDSLARKQGFRTPATLISATTGVSVGDAVRTVAVGEATAPRMTLTGESMPAKRPHVAAAMRAGAIGMPAASAIIAMLDKVALRADPAALDAMEQRLAEAAPGLTLDQLHKLIARAEAHLDPDGVEPREQELRGVRSMSFHTDRSGMFVFNGKCDPETGAPIKAAIEGLVGGMLARCERAERADCAHEGAEGAPSLVADQRVVAQMRVDALADLCRHALGCDRAPTAPSATVVVRVSLEELEAGVGAGMIDGIDQPVSIATVRRMAADAQIIPCVLGGESEILDWGRAKRLFTPAQKLALVERDGGCAFCGAPPSMAVGHHLRWWARDGGSTDLGNGILLCVSCHHRVHDDGWEIRIEGKGTTAKAWFIPPPWLDAERRPRLGGRARYDLVA
ncbi:MAG: DUF222 domain-containing protein [Microbacterium sp.]|uniref:HNH endonuclease n=1 Tax=Microbacterium sp. TaxID=51671 RepID=UPI0039E3437D